MLRSLPALARVSLAAFLALTPSASAQQDPFALIDFVGSVTYVIAGGSGSVAATTVGDLAYGEIELDLSVPPTQGPGGELSYLSGQPVITGRIGSQPLNQVPHSALLPMTVTDGQAPDPDRLDLDIHINFPGGAAPGIARFSFVDAGGDAWSSPMIEDLPSLLVPTPLNGQLAKFEILSTTGLLLIEVTLDSIDIDLTSESSSICPPLPNITGQIGRLRGQGSRAVADNQFTLFADRLPQGSFGFFIVSASQGYVPNPGGQTGNLCLAGLIGRYTGPGQVQSSGTTGTLSLRIDLTQIPSPIGASAVLAGETRYFQLWHRDISPWWGGPSNNFTDSICVSFL